MAPQNVMAKNFIAKWQGRGDEKSDSQVFWAELLREVFQIQDLSTFIIFEERVKLKNTSFIDARIPSTKVLIEQKSLGVDLRKPAKQSDGSFLTPYEQAKRYANALPVSEHPRWIITCNFQSFLVYDMDQQEPEKNPYEILLEDLEKELYRLSFLTLEKNIHLEKEKELSIKAGKIIGEIYSELLKRYQEPISPETLRSLNILSVRLVFCFYAEDAGLFPEKLMFQDYLREYEAKDMRRALIALFEVLETPLEKRDIYLEDNLKVFPYVNGGLFSEKIEIPQFTADLRGTIVLRASKEFDWSGISPTIFGSVFESTLNPLTRREGGMHYTSLENIHKVIDPLFLNKLKKEFASLASLSQPKERAQKALEFQKKLGRLSFLDPACGSGNFLTETYLSLRRLENECLKIRFPQGALDIFEDSIGVNINQFHGIEINDFATVVAQTALWIAESQMMRETENILKRNLNFLPLKSYPHIVNANSLERDWQEVISPENLSYIIGNPPFNGARLMSKNQKEDVQKIFKGFKELGNLDYVACWFKKASDYMRGTLIEASFVSTNSITQGEQVAPLFKPLIEEGIVINFAYPTFVWNSETFSKAHVHCIIIGFSYTNREEKYLFLEEKGAIQVEKINPYLIEGENIFIEKRTKPLGNIPEIVYGNKPIEGGNLLIHSEEELQEYLSQEPQGEKFIRPFLGSEEFINNKKRWCFWLKGVSPSEIKKLSLLSHKIEAVREMRLNSKDKYTKEVAYKYPTLFASIRQPEEGSFLVIPLASSSRRNYIPLGFLSHHTIVSNLVSIIPNASLYEFGVLTSSWHMTWVKTFGGRLKSDYRYSARLLYNTFPWCEPSGSQKAKIEKTAQEILNARSLYPESSLADLYDPTFMPKELRKAHEANDKAVCEAYGWDKKISESDALSNLMRMYQEQVEKG